MTKKLKRILCCLMAAVLMLTGIQYESIVNAAEAGTAVETKIDKVISGYLENHISFLLSEADYTTFSILGADHEEYSYWNNIRVYTSETEYVPLSEVAVSGEYYYNLFGTTKDITIKLNNGDSVTKIVIPAGTVFPSEAYTGGIAAGWGPQASESTSTAMNGYKTKKEITLTRPDAKNETLNGTEIYNWTIEAAEPEPGTATETKVDKVISGYLENHISFLLSEADYTTFSILGADHEEYSYWNNIRVYTSETEYVPLSEVAVSGEYYYNLFGTTKDITIKLNNGDSVTKIVIPAGTVFPSEAYTGGMAAGWGPQASVFTSTAMDGYKTKKEITLTRPDAKNETLNGTEIYNWTIEEAEPEPGTPVDSGIQKVISGHNGNHLSIQLTTSDYATFTTLGDKHTDYSYWTDILVYTSDTEYKPLSEVALHSDYYYNLCGTGNDISFNMQGVENTATKIVIPEGTVFPSLAYTGGETISWLPGVEATSEAMNGYKITKEITLTRPAEKNETLQNGTEVYNWTITEKAPEPGTPVDSGIVKVISGHNGNHLSIQLTASDYATFTTLGDKHTDYSYWTDILVYTSDTEYKPLSEVALHSDYYYNLCGTGNDISFNMQGVENTATKIVIPEGTVFPSLAYTGGKTISWLPGVEATSEAMNGYKITKEITLTRPAEKNETLQNGTEVYNWTITEKAPEPGTPVDSGIQKVISGHNGKHMSIQLTASDYSSFAELGDKHMEYTYWEDILVYTSDTEYKTLGEVAAQGDCYYNLCGSGSDISLNMQGAEATATKIVIPAGTVFPSRAYTTGETNVMNGYKITEKITLTRPEETNDMWGTTPIYSWKIIYGDPVVKDTEVKEAYLSGRDGDVRLILTLSAHDYKGIGNNIFLGDKFTHYNTLDKIVLCAGDKQVPLSEVVSDEVYFNLWGREGSISYGLKSEYKVSSFNAIIIKAGCEFPSYDYISNDVVDSKVTFKTVGEKKVSIVAVQNQQEQDVEETPSFESSEATGSGNVFSSASQITYVEGEGSGQDAVTDDDVKLSTDDVDEQNEVKDDAATDGEASGKVNLGKVVVPVIAGVLLIGIIVWLLARKNRRTRIKSKG